MLGGVLDLGYEAHGVELNAAAAAGVDPRVRMRIAPQLADARYADSTFDAVILWHVLEHLPRPDATLAEIARILKPGGRLILAVPNSGSLQATWSGPNWFHLDLPRHLYHFDDKTLTRLVDRYGFQIRSMRHFALLQNPFGWLQSALNQLTDAPRNSLYSLLHRYGSANQKPLSRSQRIRQRAAYWLGLPIAGVLSVIEAAMGRGGTIALVAELPAKIESKNLQSGTIPECVCPSFAGC
jgi:SAM-dependent methyltransferase